MDDVKAKLLSTCEETKKETYCLVGRKAEDIRKKLKTGNSVCFTKCN